MKPADLDGFSQMARKLGIADGTLATIKAQVVDPTNPDAYDMIGVYTPGTALETYPGDSAKLLKAGPDSYINFNIHYTTSGRIETDRTQLALWFASQPPKHQLFRAPAAVDTIIANGRELLSDDPGTKAEGTNVAIPPIPSYADDYELIGMTAYRDAVTIFQFQPHAHMRGKDFKYLVIFPDGHEETVLTVPRYDFHWQLAYALAQPLALPAGSKLVVVAHYDNSATSYARRSKDIADPANNCGPDKVAYFRRENQSWDEMFSPLIQYAVDSAPRLPEIQAVGCLVSDSHDRWSLGTAGKPVASHAEDTSSAEVAAAAATGFGKHRYELLGAEFFNPARYVHQKVVLKGVLIGAENHGRINVTSLQPLGSSCP
jgi:hypothetical protein